MRALVHMDFSALNDNLLARAQALLFEWFPEGKVRGREFHVGSLLGEPGNSLSVNMQTGVWKDFADDVGGSDLVSLYAAKEHIKQSEAFERLGGQRPTDMPRAPSIGRLPVRTEEPIPRVPDMRHPEYGMPVASWVYRDHAGLARSYVARYQPEGRRKQIIPWTWDNASRRWVARAPAAPRPLYGLELLDAAPALPVMLVEGEKSADAARLFAADDYLVMTWSGGASAVGQSDWSALHGREVLVWPDADDAGAKAAARVESALKGIAESVTVLDLPAGLPKGWDAADAQFTVPEWRDWIAARLKVAEEHKPVLVPAPSAFVLPDAMSIPRREFVGGNYAYPRGVCTAVVGAGGSAKSSLSIVEALALATGRQLLHVPAGEPARVWMLNLEDPMEELQRRIVAACMHFGIRDEDLGGRLFVNSGMDGGPFVTGETTRHGTTIYQPMFDALAAHIRERGIDAMTVDPFVSTHRVTENDNGAIDAVTKAWSKLAHQTRICLVLVHHLRKLMGREATAEDIRGGSSMVGAVRLARVVNPMSQDEALKAGIPDEAWRYFRTTDGKANLTPRSDRSTWYRLESVRLPNGDIGAPGDNVGVVTPWKWPDAFEGVTTSDLKRVHAALATGDWKADSRGKGEWVGKLVGQICEIDIADPAGREQVSRMVRTWIDTGALRIEERIDRNRNKRNFVVPGDISEGEA